MHTTQIVSVSWYGNSLTVQNTVAATCNTSFEVQEFWILPTENIYGFFVILRWYSDYLFKHNKMEACCLGPEVSKTMWVKTFFWLFASCRHLERLWGPDWLILLAWSSTCIYIAHTVPNSPHIDPEEGRSIFLLNVQSERLQRDRLCFPCGKWILNIIYVNFASMVRENTSLSCGRRDILELD